MKTTRWTGLLMLPFLAACAADAPGSSDAPPFEPVGDMQQLMATVVEPAADFYWDAVGTIIDLEGTEEIFPRSDEEWEAVLGPDPKERTAPAEPNLDIPQTLSDHAVWLEARGKEGARAQLVGKDLSGADLSNADLSNANLRGTDLSGADCSGANFEGVDLRQAVLLGARS